MKVWIEKTSFPERIPAVTRWDSSPPRLCPGNFFLFPEMRAGMEASASLLWMLFFFEKEEIKLPDQVREALRGFEDSSGKSEY